MAKRFGGTPEELIADGEGAEVFATHLHLPHATHRNGEGAGDGGGCEAINVASLLFSTTSIQSLSS